MSPPPANTDDAIEPVRSAGNGVYSLRQVRSTTGVGSLPSRLHQRRKADIEESPNVEERDLKTRQVRVTVRPRVFR
jgi:hypothetical protein